MATTRDRDLDLEGGVEYPESDGRPMAETPVHRRQLTDLIEMIDRHLGGGPPSTPRAT